MLNVLGEPTVLLSSRTDSGVHARGQVAHAELPIDGLAKIPDLALAANRFLPSTIQITGVHSNVDPRFHSQLDATHRWYRYRIFNRPTPSALLPQDATWVRLPLNVAAMAQAAGLFQGEHDFKSFQCPDTAITDSVCRVHHSRVWQPDPVNNPHEIVFDIVANRFVYRMVRNLTGFLLRVGATEDPLPPEVFGDILAHQNREAPEMTDIPPAPARGLCLMAVGYPLGKQYFAQTDAIKGLESFLCSSYDGVSHAISVEPLSP